MRFSLPACFPPGERCRRARHIRIGAENLDFALSGHRRTLSIHQVIGHWRCAWPAADSQTIVRPAARTLLKGIVEHLRPGPKAVRADARLRRSIVLDEDSVGRRMVLTKVRNWNCWRH